MIIYLGGFRLFWLYIYNSITIINSTFKGNTDFATRTVVAGRGYVIVNFTHCNFTDGLRIIDTWHSIVTLTKCQMINATSKDSMISLSNNSNAQITDSNIMFLSQNDQPFIKVSMNSSITITGCLYFKSSLQSHFLLSNDTIVRIYNSSFVHNIADSEEAAILSVDYGKLGIQNTIFIQNTARSNVILSARRSDIEVKDTNITLNNYIKEDLKSGFLISTIFSNLTFLNCNILNNTMTYLITAHSELHNYIWMIKCTVVQNRGGIVWSELSNVHFEESFFINSGSFFARNVAVVRISKSVIRGFSLRNEINMKMLTYKSTFQSGNMTANSKEDGHFLDTLFPIYNPHVPQWETEFASCEYVMTPILRSCLHGTIATPICLSQIILCTGLSFIVTIAVHSAFANSCLISYKQIIVLHFFQFSLYRVDLAAIASMIHTRTKMCSNAQASTSHICRQLYLSIPLGLH